MTITDLFNLAPIRTLILICVISLSSPLMAQDSTVYRGETILRIDKSKVVHSEQKLLWLKKNGFSTDEYDWDNTELNTQVRHVLGRRNGVRVWRIIAAGLALQSLRWDSDIGDATLGYAVSGLSLIVSESKNAKARKQVKQLEKWRLERLPTMQTPIPTSSQPTASNFQNMVYRSPYSISKNRYLKSAGFDMDLYDFKDLEINKTLDKALSMRTSSTVLAASGSGLLVYGFLMYAYSGIVDNNPDGRTNMRNTGNVLMGLSVGSFLTAMIVKGESRKKVKQAEKLRNQKY